MKHILTNPYHEVLRFDKGEEVYEGILHFLKEQEIAAGWIWGLGAASSATLSFYNLEKKEYQDKEFNEPLEVLEITGNIAVNNNVPIIHLHGTFGREDFSTIGGHVKKLIASGTVEIFIHKIEGQMNRQLDEGTGLNLLHK